MERRSLMICAWVLALAPAAVAQNPPSTDQPGRAAMERRWNGAGSCSLRTSR